MICPNFNNTLISFPDSVGNGWSSDGHGVTGGDGDEWKVVTEVGSKVNTGQEEADVL